MASVLNGFDYRTQTACTRTRAEWREDVQAALDSGGYVKGYQGERLVFSRRGRILFEIYDRDSLNNGSENETHVEA